MIQDLPYLDLLMVAARLAHVLTRGPSFFFRCGQLNAQDNNNHSLVIRTSFRYNQHRVSSDNSRELSSKSVPKSIY